ncbi:MAG: hypothetical protein R3E89_04670 [Thiolinea sp.]
MQYEQRQVPPTPADHDALKEQLQQLYQARASLKFASTSVGEFGLVENSNVHAGRDDLVSLLDGVLTVLTPALTLLENIESEVAAALVKVTG